MNRQEAVVWLAGLFDEPAANLKESTLREEIYGWDSLGTLTLMAELDEKFGIQLAEKELTELHSVCDVLDLLVRRNALNPG